MLNSLKESIFGKKKEFQPPIRQTFKLPIEYLPENQIKKINTTVRDDLDLVNIYNHLSNITDKKIDTFEKNIINTTCEHFTISKDYLKDTQTLIVNSSNQINSNCKRPALCSELQNIYESIYEDENFMDKYNFMDIEMLKYLNHSSAYLQSLSIVQLISPLSSIIIPMLMCLIPFVLLKLKGIAIDLNSYFALLKEIAKHHFIGKTLNSIHNISFYNVGKIFLLIGFYFMQIYQNILSLNRFYKNIKRIHTHIYLLTQYLHYIENKMNEFIQISIQLKTYQPFLQKIYKYSEKINIILNDLSNISEFSNTTNTLNSLGYILKCYYSLHNDEEARECIEFAFGFDGYLNINDIIATCFKHQKINKCTFTNKNKKSKLIKQKYPFQLKFINNINQDVNHDGIPNSCNLNKNMIITGVNASGKTTLLKTTAINIIFTQQYGCGFYENCVLSPYSHIHSYLNIPDTSGRDSLFQAEARRCKQILDVIESNPVEERHFCIFDELYSGTNPVEASKIAFTFLLYLSKYENVDFMMTTHYVHVCKKVKKHAKHIISNYQMDAIFHTFYTEYTYKLKKGICEKEGALNILKGLDYPIDIINQLI